LCVKLSLIMEKNIDSYIQECPPEVQARLYEVHSLIEAIAKDATQCISWGMPTFKMRENLEFEDRLKDFKHSKGAIQFPYAKELPIKLIQDIVQYRVDCLTK